VPLLATALAAVTRPESGKAVGVDLLGLLRGDDADLVVLAAVLATGVVDGVDVELRCLGFPGQLSQALDEFFLEVIRKAVLLAEVDDTAPRDCKRQ